MSTFELLRSGLVPALLAYLTPGGARLQAFLRCFGAQAVRNLVRILQEALSKTESFGLTTVDNAQGTQA